MRSVGKFGIAGCILVALSSSACSDQAVGGEQLDRAAESILRGTPDTPATAGGFVYLANLSARRSGSGVLLDNQWVLTAAHVAEAAARPGRAGDLFVDLGTQTRQAQEVFLHPLWNGDGESENPNIVDVALVKVSTPFTGNFKRNISPLGTPDLIDVQQTTRCRGYGPTDINLAEQQGGGLNRDGTLAEPAMTRADFTMENFPPKRSNSFRSSFGFCADQNAQQQVTYPGDSGGACVATSGTADIYGIVASGRFPPCKVDADCKGFDDRCVIPPGQVEGDCRIPKTTVFEAAQGFRAFADAHLRQRSADAHLANSTSSDRITLRVDEFGQYVMDFEIEGAALLTLPTGVMDTPDLQNIAQMEVADFDGDGLDDIMWSLDGFLPFTGEAGRFAALFSTRHFGGAWEPFLNQLLLDVLAGQAHPAKDFPFLINSTFAFIESTNFLGEEGKGIRSLQPHGGSVEFHGNFDGDLVADLPPRGFDFNGDGDEDVAAVSTHRVDVTLGGTRPLPLVSLHQDKFAGAANVSLGDVAWGDFDGSCSVNAEDPQFCQSELVVASPLEEVPGQQAGALHYFKYDGTARTLSRGNLPGIPASAGRLGTALAVGDFNADGYDDLAVAASTSPTTTGVMVISGGPGGLDEDSPVEVLTHDMFDSFDEGFFGYALTAGDFDCDGIEDLAIGQPWYTGPFIDQNIEQGAVVVVYGGQGALGDQLFVRLEKEGLIPGHANFQDALGTGLAAGNFDGDSWDGHACVDLAIAAEWEGRLNDIPEPRFEVGGVYVVRGFPSWSADTIEVQHLFQGENGIQGERTANAHFGHTLAIGRMNEDRFDDLIVGQPDLDGESGGVHVLLGEDLVGIGASGHAFFQLDSDGIPTFGAAAAGARFGDGLGSLSRGLVVVGSTRLDAHELNDSGLLSLIQFAQTPELQIGQTSSRSEEQLFTVGELSEAFFTPKPIATGFEAFLAEDGGYWPTAQDSAVQNHRFGSAISSARPPFENPLFSKRTDLGRQLNGTVLLESGGFGKLKQPDSVPQPAGACYYATQTLEVKDRAVLTAESVLAGTGLTLSSEAWVSGDVRVAASASARDRARITGSVSVAGTLSLVNGATVSGTVTQHASVPLEALTAPSVTAGSQSITVANDQTRTLVPGSYGQVLVRARGKLVLGPGVYNFSSLTLEDAKLVALNRQGTTVINVAQLIDLRDRSQVTGDNPAQLRFNSPSTGTLRIGNDATFNGFVSAPQASIEVGSRSKVSSCMAAKKLIFQPDARIGGLN